MTGLPSGTKIGTVHLTVRDLAGTAAFYREVLGYRRAPPGVPEEGAAPQGDGGVVRFSATGAPPYDLVLYPGSPAGPRRRTAGLYHFAVLLPSRADLARALRHLIDAQAPIEGASDHAVSEAVYLHDPEGNGIEIYADRPRDRWPVRGGTLQMTTKPLDMDDLFRTAGGRWEGMPEGTHIGHIHLRVNDLDRAETFYAGVLGFDVMVRGYPGALFVAAGGYHHHIGLNTWAGPLPPADPGGLGLRYFTIVLPDPQARDAVLARARHAGLPPAAPAAATVEPGPILRDPDGIGVMPTI